MAFAELGLTEKEFWALPPFRTYLMQLHNRRNVDRMWEQTRQIVAMINNTAQGVKRKITAQQFIRLPFDGKHVVYDWTPEEANEIIEKWKDLPKSN